MMQQILIGAIVLVIGGLWAYWIFWTLLGLFVVTLGEAKRVGRWLLG